MHTRNTSTQYGWPAILLHWLTALAVIGLFALGLYMDDLDYYDPLYKTLPHIHKSVGVLLFALLLYRIYWRWRNPQPVIEGSPTEKRIASWLHRIFYLLLTAIPVSGYLISTADGRPIDVFNWFSIPAIISNIDGQEDIAGEVHEILAFTLIFLALLHTAAALKHHFINKDNTLKKMLSTNKKTHGENL